MYLKTPLKSIGMALVCLMLSTPLPVSSASAKNVTFSFKGTDVKEFIIAVADILQYTITIDSRVNGKVNIESYKTITKAELRSIFHTQLQLNGFVAIETGKNVWRVIPASLAKMQPELKIYSKNVKYDKNAIITRVIPTSVEAQSLLAIVKPMVNTTIGAIEVYASGSSLVITDKAQNINRIMTVIRRLEKTAFSSYASKIVSLDYIVPSTLEKRLASFVSKHKNDDMKKLSVIANDELNSLILTGSDFAIKTAVDLIKQLDVRTPQVLVEAVVMEIEDSVNRTIGIDFLYQ